MAEETPAVFVRDCQRAEMDGILVNMLEQDSTVCSFRWS